MIVCGILGHVDHGKTTLIKKLCNTNITESGSVTTFIKSYVLEDKYLFIDNPGHESWQSLQEYIFKKSDIILLVVDTTQGPQKTTNLVIDLINRDKKPFIIVLTKTELPTNINAEEQVMELIYSGEYLCTFKSTETHELLTYLSTLIDIYNDEKLFSLESINNNLLKVFKRKVCLKEPEYTIKGYPNKEKDNFITYKKLPSNISVEHLIHEYEINFTRKAVPSFQYNFQKIGIIVACQNIVEAINIFQNLLSNVQKYNLIDFEFVFYTNKLNEQIMQSYKHCKVISTTKHPNTINIEQHHPDLSDITIRIIESKCITKISFVKKFVVDGVNIYGFKLIKGTINCGDMIICNNKIGIVKTLQSGKNKIETFAVINENVGIVIDGLLENDIIIQKELFIYKTLK